MKYIVFLEYVFGFDALIAFGKTKNVTNINLFATLISLFSFTQKKTQPKKILL
jgi:hypothetical protein